MLEAAKKVIKVREIVGSQIRIEVDGGIDPQTTPAVVSYGADTLVVGNAIFSKSDRIAAINAIRAACRKIKDQSAKIKMTNKNPKKQK